jgi:hypothetical protein
MERQGGKALHDLDTLGVIVLAPEPIHHKLEGLVRRTVDFLRTRPVGVRPYNLLGMQFLVVDDDECVDYHLFPGVLVQGSEQLFIGRTFAPFLEEPSARARNNERESEP